MTSECAAQFLWCLLLMLNISAQHVYSLLQIQQDLWRRSATGCSKIIEMRLRTDVKAHTNTAHK